MIVWLASYPRSGNTFLRILLKNVFQLNTYSIYGDKADIAADQKTSEVVGHKLLPDGFTVDAARESEELYLIKTHDYPVNDSDKAIYLMRDGRECSLSFAKHEQDFGLQYKSLMDVIYGNVVFGSWGQHISHWSPGSRDNTLLIKFEEMINDPWSFVEEIAAFIQVDPAGASIPTFEELNKVNSKFFRSGKTDSWKQAYSEDEHLAFWLNNYAQMVEYGYVQDMPDMFRNPDNVRLLSQLCTEISYYHTAVSKKLDQQYQNLNAGIAKHVNNISSVRELASHVEKTQEWQSTIKDMTALLDKRQTRIDQLNEKLCKQQDDATSLLDLRQARIDQLNEKLHKLQEHATSVLGRRQARIDQLNEQLRKLQSRIHEQDMELTGQKTEIVSKDEHLHELKILVNKQQVELNERQAEIADQGEQVQRLLALTSDQEARLDKQRTTIDGLEGRQETRQSVLGEQEKKLQERDIRIHELEGQLRDKQARLNEKNRNIQEKQKAVNKKNNEIVALRNRLKNKERELSMVQGSIRYRLGTSLAQPYVKARSMASTVRNIKEHGALRRKVNLGDQLSVFYGKHRSGWSYAVSALADLHDENAIYLDTFIERTFDWAPGGPSAITKPWIGFIHVPPNVQDWFQSHQSNQAIFSSRVWRESLPFCRGLFTLSKYHREVLAKTLSLPLDNLIHPTEIPEAQWSWDKFMANREKKIIQLGWWLRKLHAIFQLPESDYRKVFLKVNNEDYLNALIEKEKQLLLAAGEFKPGMYDTAETVSFLPNQQYDEWLSENIGFVYLYDSSANNAVIECIARNTPLLVNPIPAVREYLGEGYPFYYESFEEAIAKASDIDTVRKTYEYLRKNPIKKKLTGEYFRKSLVRSPIMKKVHRMAS